MCFFFFFEFAISWLADDLNHLYRTVEMLPQVILFFFLLINWGKARMEWRDLQELLSPIGVSRESGCCCLLFTTALPPSGWSLVLV